MLCGVGICGWHARIGMLKDVDKDGGGKGGARGGIAGGRWEDGLRSAFIDPVLNTVANLESSCLAAEC